MKKQLLVMSTCLLMFSGRAQVDTSYQFLDINNLKIPVFPTGEIFGSGSYLTVKSEMPINSGKSSNFTSSLWLGGLDDANTLHLAANTYRQVGESDFQAGPNTANYVQPTHHRVYKITKAQIEHHANNYNQPGYNMIDVIAKWPGHGNGFSLGLNFQAPFKDKNQNGVYDPANGDFPEIRGDQALYVMYNDNIPHTESGAEIIHAQVNVMVYGYDTSDVTLDNTVFVHYDIHNMSTANYKDFYITSFNDFDLGFGFDDYIGTDSASNSVFVYNGDSLDESLSGYGDNPPVFGMTYLNHTLNNSMYYNNNFSNFGNPTDSSHYYNYQKALFKNDSTQMQFTQSVKYAYEESILTEAQAFTTPDDRRILSSIYMPSLKASESICLDLAYVFAYDTTNNIAQQKTLFKNRVAQVKNFYDDQYDNCQDLSDLDPNLNTNLFDEKAFELWQNNSELFIKSPKEFRSIKVINVLGETVFNKNGNVKSISLNHYPKGTYILQVETIDGLIANQKFVLK
ncbi:MAG: T9SS type A sorting domain-containing protein [Flavobacteriales bacterium]|jgi:hypothetical protein|nr:T9SS type A sorting domain-containing protein [Flavobacteriales bacterium]